MNLIAKKILNNIRCPICSGQLDLPGWQVEQKNKDYNFFCVNDFRHYGIFLIHWDLPISIEQEGVTIFEGSHRFDVVQKNGSTKITIRDVDLEERILDNIKPIVFEYDKEMFIFSQTNREKIINRIKTILVFQ